MDAHKDRTRGGKGAASGPRVGSSPPADIASTLRANELNEWDIPLKNIRFTEHCRQTNPLAVEAIVKKIGEVGWMPTALPQVTVPGLEDGMDMTAELAATAEAFVLDGNHRLKAAQQFYVDVPDKTIRCQCYREFENTFMKKIISDACNGVQETHAKRTTYDQVFFYSTMVSELMRLWAGNSRTRRREVKSADLKSCWKGVGSPPSDSSLRQWLEICKTCKSEALLSLRSMTEKAVPGFERITKNFLHDSAIRQLKDKPLQQSLVLEIYARTPKGGGGKIDMQPVLKQAEDVAGWMQGIELIVPKEQWSTGLTDTINAFAFEKVGHYPNYVKPHQQNIAAEIIKLESGLPAHAPTLDTEAAAIVRAQPLGQIRSTLQSDASLRPFLEEYERKYEAAKNAVNALKLQIVPPSGHAGQNKKTGKKGGKDQDHDKEGDDDEGDDGDGDGVGTSTHVLCVLCNPPPTSSYICVHCKAVHVGDCSGATPVGDDERAKERKCRNCAATKGQRAKERPGVQGDDDEAGPSSPSGKGKGKGKKRKAGATPVTPPKMPKIPSSSGSDGDLKIVRREENACLHHLMPLSASCPDQEISNIKLEQPAMLMFISLNRQEHLLQESTASSERLKRLLYHMCKELLHAKGTVIVALPNPYFIHVGRIVEYLKQSGLGLAVEDFGLVVEYGSRGGGLTAESKKQHTAGGLDFYIIAHHNNVTKDGCSDFKFNKDVSPKNFPERMLAHPKPASRASGTTPYPSTSLMDDVPYKGQQRAFHDNVARFGILRFTTQGDTVVTFSAESDGVIECALHLGRKVEMFVATDGAGEAVAARVEEAWEEPWRAGKFPRDASNSTFKYIAPGSLPAGIPEDTTPARVSRLLREIMEQRKDEGSTPSSESLLECAKTLATNFMWRIKTSTTDNLVCLHAVDGERYTHGSAEIPMWGTPVVYNTRQDALDSLSPDDDDMDLQYVRLVHVADYSLLKRMCVPSKEGVRSPDAGLYLKVSPTCPAFYALWDDSTDQTAHEVSSYLERGWKREALVNAFIDNAGGKPAPVKLNVYKTIEGSTGDGAVVKVTPGVCVVRRGWCDEGDAGAVEGLAAGGAQDESAEDNASAAE